MPAAAFDMADHARLGIVEGLNLSRSALRSPV